MTDLVNYGGYYKQRMAREYPGVSDHNERVMSSVKIWRAAETQTGELIRIPVDRIIKAVCDAYKVARHELTGPRRSHYLLTPRYHAIALAVDLRPDLSLTTIGGLFNRDHSTVIHAKDAWYTTHYKGRGDHIRAVNAILFKDAEPMVG